jgi:O-antigen/teichoic acid export membrane protein
MTLKANKKKAFIINVKWQFIGGLAQTGFNGILLLLMGRELGPFEFGIFSIVMGFVLVINLLFDPRIHDVVAKQFWDFEVESNKNGIAYQYFIDLFIIEAICKLIPCIVLILFSSLLVKMGNLPYNSEILIIIAAVATYLSKIGNGLCVGFLRVLGRSDVIVICATSEVILRLCITWLLITQYEYNVLGAIITLAVTSIASNLIQWKLTIKFLNEFYSSLKHWRMSESFQRLLENKRLLLANIGLSASDLMNKDLDITLISRFVTADQVGLYKMAKNICMLIWRAIDPLYFALMPEINRRYLMADINGVEAIIKKTFYILLSASIILSISIFLTFQIFGGNILGKEYIEIITIIPWMLIGIVVSAPLIWGHPLSVSIGNPEYTFMGSIIGQILGLLAFLILTPYFGVVGAAFAWSLSLMTSFIFTSLVSYNKFKKLIRILN